MEIVQAFHTVRGYDCRYSCQHAPKGDHGIHAEEWIYRVTTSDAALVLAVGTSNYPPTVAYPPRDQRPPYGADITLHTAWSIDEETIRQGTPGNRCEFIPGGRCFTAYTSVLDARDFFAQYGRPYIDQSETFWQALEARLIELRTAAEAKRADRHWKQCDTCHGAGTVKLEEEAK